MDLKQYKAKIREQLLNGMNESVQREKAIEQGDYVTGGGAKKGSSHYHIPKHDYDELLRQMSIFRGPIISMPGHVTTGHDCGGGSLNVPDDDSDDPTDVGGSFMGKKVMRKVMKKVRKSCATMDPENSESDGDDEVVEGGKFHFVKSLKHMGKDLGNTLKNAGIKAVKAEIENAASGSAQGAMVQGGKFKLGKSLKHFGREVGDSFKKSGIQAVTKEVTNAGVKYAKDNLGKMMSEAIPMAEEEAPMMLMAAGIEKKPKRTRKVSQKEANRHALIRKIMQKHGCSLAEASKYIKEKKLEY